MTSRLHSKDLLTQVEIVSPPVIHEERACTDQNFGLPTGVFVAMFGLFAGAIGVLALSFRSGMVVTYAVLFAFLVAFFGIPALFVKTSPGARSKALSWAEFQAKGIHTATGRTPAGEAIILSLALPFFIFAWAVAISVIAHFVG